METQLFNNNSLNNDNDLNDLMLIIQNDLMISHKHHQIDHRPFDSNGYQFNDHHSVGQNIADNRIDIDSFDDDNTLTGLDNEGGAEAGASAGQDGSGGGAAGAAAAHPEAYDEDYYDDDDDDTDKIYRNLLSGNMIPCSSSSTPATEVPNPEAEWPSSIPNDHQSPCIVINDNYEPSLTSSMSSSLTSSLASSSTLSSSLSLSSNSFCHGHINDDNLMKTFPFTTSAQHHGMRHLSNHYHQRSGNNSGHYHHIGQYDHEHHHIGQYDLQQHRQQHQHRQQDRLSMSSSSSPLSSLSSPSTALSATSWTASPTSTALSSSLSVSPLSSSPSTFQCHWFECNDCTFSNLIDLVKHIEFVHIEPQRIMQQHKYQQQQQQEHHGPQKVNDSKMFICKWYQCHRNGKSFDQRYKLINHMHIHTGYKPKICTYPGCQKSFSRQENLKNHYRTHTKDKPYCCEYNGCQKMFANTSDRAKHRRIHLDPKPFRCQIDGCPNVYTDPSSLRKHRKKKHLSSITDNYHGYHLNNNRLSSSWSSSSSMPFSISPSMQSPSIQHHYPYQPS